MKRTTNLERTTKETSIKLTFHVDGSGQSTIETGIGFFDHMLDQIAKHGFFDISIFATGDTSVDCHHTIEDVGILLGQGIKQALGSKEGIVRYGYFILPMEDALVLCSLDISGRPFLQFDVSFSTPSIGGMDTEMIEEFFRAVCLHAGINMHIKLLSGKNNHHIAEAVFKAFAKSLDQAVSIDSRINGVLSSKGMLEQ